MYGTISGEVVIQLRHGEHGVLRRGRGGSVCVGVGGGLVKLVGSRDGPHNNIHTYTHTWAYLV